MKWFKVFMVGAVGAVLAACNNGVIGTPGGQVGKITVSPTTVQMGANQTKSLTATVEDKAGKPLSNVEVSWEVANTEVVRVTPKDKLVATLTGVKAGQTDVYAVVSGVKSAPVQVVVGGNNPVPPPPPPPGPIKGLSGTVYMPAGGDIKDTVVWACALKDLTCNTNDPRTQYVIVGNSGTSYNFSFDLEPTDYLLIAVKDVNHNNVRDDGDYWVCYGGQGTNDCAILTPPQKGLEVRLKLVGSGKPTPTPGESSISGQVFAVKGSNLSGAILHACNLLTLECKELPYKGTANQASYTFEVSKGVYVIDAWRDINKNGELDQGDHYGCYQEEGECALVAVEGSMKGKDIYLSVEQGTGEIQSLQARTLEPFWPCLRYRPMAIGASACGIVVEKYEALLRK